MAIINQAYSKVKEEMVDAQPEFMLSDYLKLNYSKVVDRLNLRRDRILDIQEVLKSEEVAQKDDLDFNIWRRELKVHIHFTTFFLLTFISYLYSIISLQKKGYADMEIQSLFSRYDKNCDKRLTEVEKIRLIKDISKARVNISKEFKNFKKNRDTRTKKDAFE